MAWRLGIKERFLVHHLLGMSPTRCECFQTDPTLPVEDSLQQELISFTTPKPAYESGYNFLSAVY